MSALQPEPRTVSDRMREMRRRRRERGLVEVRVWVRPEDRGAVKAGPELLEAAKWLMAALNGYRNEYGDGWPAKEAEEKALHAIAKAESKGND